MNLLLVPCLRAWRRRWLPWSRPVMVATLALLAVVSTLGCALLGKADMLGTRYFEPELPRPEAATKATVTPAGAPMELRLGRVTASAYLRNRLVYRTSSVELGAYEDRQWTERPEEYLRRAVAIALFDVRGIRHVLSGDSPTLDVELAAFEELRHGDRSTGRVTIRYALRDPSSVWMTDSITVDRATKQGSRQPEDVVAAIAAALASAAGAVADKVDARLRREAAKSPPRSPDAT